MFYIRLDIGSIFMLERMAVSFGSFKLIVRKNRFSEMSPASIHYSPGSILLLTKLAAKRP